MSWYNNRKFVGAISVSVASLIVIVATEFIPDFNIPIELIASWLTFVFVMGVFIVGGDVGFDWIREFKKPARDTVDFASKRDWFPDTDIDEDVLALIKKILQEEQSKSGGDAQS